jgi:hypothetical protein
MTIFGIILVVIAGGLVVYGMKIGAERFFRSEDPENRDHTYE